MHRRRRRLTLLAGLLLFLPACSDRLLAPEPSTPEAAPPPPAADVQEVERLAKALAVALGDPELRLRVLQDLRDSPFPNHKLHLDSYLRGQAGREIAVAAAAAAGVAPEELLAAGRGAAGLELWMPVSLDRARWSGTDDIVVVGSARPRADALRHTPELQGYRAGGEPVSVSTQERNPFPILAIFPAEQPFGADPEAARSAAPRKGGLTVSTREAEFERALQPRDGEALRYVDPCMSYPEICDPRCVPERTSACPYAPPPPQGTPTASGYTSQMCFTVYSAAQDADNDGVLDDCEYELAHAFRPFLALSPGDDGTGREPYWAVARVRNPAPGYERHLRIFYALSYYDDGGTPSGGFYAHQGDAEFIIIQVVEAAAGRWYLFRATLSAHWGKMSDATETVEDWWLSYPEGVARARPLVWVAEDKHANYKSRISCDEGAYYADNCDDNRYNTWDPYYTVEILRDANLGDGRTGWIRNCVNSRRGRPGYECFWYSWYPFYGWHVRSGSNAGPYYDPLWAFGF